MKICLNRGTAGGGLPLDQFVSLACDAGFNGADVDLGYAEQNGTAALHDLYQSKKMSFGAWGPPVDFRAEATKYQDGLATLSKWAKVAQELKIDSCATYILPSSDLPLIENWKFHVDRLKPMAKILADNGLRFGLEFVAPYHLRRKFKHEFIFTPGQMLQLGDDVGPNTGLLVDCFHCLHAGTPWSEVAKWPAEKIVLVHLNDAHDLPLVEQLDGERMIPGDGVMDLVGFVKALKSAGYSGPASVEVFSDELRKMPAAQAARKAAAGAKKVFTAAGV